MSHSQTIPSGHVRITGLGAITPYGDSAGRFWEAIASGKDAFKPITLFPTHDHRTSFAAEIEKSTFFKPKRIDEKILSRADAMALAAASEALAQSGLLENSAATVRDPGRMGIVVGTAAGGILGLERFFRQRRLNRPDGLASSLLSSFCLSSIATNIAREFAITGPRMTIATVCSSSGLAMAAAKELIEAGDIDVALIVGAETLSEVTHAGFNILRSVAPQICQPFDANRKGLVLGEGAGAIVLEKTGFSGREHIPTLAYFNGYGLMTDLHHFTAPHPEGDAISETIELALKDASISQEDIDYVNAHGTGTQLNDIAESRGIKRAFSSHAEKLSISSIKSMIGHTLGAASIFEAIATVFSLIHDTVPPTANLTSPDPECDLDFTPLVSKKKNIQHAVSNSFAFGGSNISLVFQKEPGSGIEAQPEAITARLPVITGIGVVTPVGIGKEAFAASIEKKRSGIGSLKERGAEWEGYSGGLVDMTVVKEAIPVKLRRRLNRQGAFLFVSMDEAIEDAGLDREIDDRTAYIYGSAFGCSENVHRFYTTLLEDGPKYTSPQEFGFSVTNAPPSLVSQMTGRKGPVWVVVADEASWDISFHYGAMLIRKGRADRVIVSAAEEISSSVLAIHQELGMLKKETEDGLTLGEGAVSVVIESDRLAIERGARIYGTVLDWDAVNDTSCGPQDYSKEGSCLLKAASHCLENIEGTNSGIMCVSPENGMRVVASAADKVRDGLKKRKGANIQTMRFKEAVGESGAAGGMGLAAGLLSDSLPPGGYILILTSARGGMNTATLVRSK